MIEPYYRMVHIHEDDAEPMLKMLARIHAERGDDTDRTLLLHLSVAISLGVRYGGQRTKEHSD